MLLAVPLAVAAIAAGCGGDDDSSATEQWAGDVCSAVSEWTTSLRETADSLTAGSVGENGLQDAVADIKAATSTLADDLRGLGPPETESGDEAKQALDELSTQIEGDVDKIENALEDASSPTETLTAVSTVSATLASMATAVGAAFEQLEQLDAGGELEDAFRSASSCDELTNENS
jgi:ABC-type transporter Mla subunit MlaD